MSDLKSCPFCGTTKNLGYLSEPVDGFRSKVVVCNGCGTKGPTNSKCWDVSREEWNTRPTCESCKHVTIGQYYSFCDNPIFKSGGVTSEEVTLKDFSCSEYRKKE